MMPLAMAVKAVGRPLFDVNVPRATTDGAQSLKIPSAGLSASSSSTVEACAGGGADRSGRVAATVESNAQRRESCPTTGGIVVMMRGEGRDDFRVHGTFSAPKAVKMEVFVFMRSSFGNASLPLLPAACGNDAVDLTVIDIVFL